MLNSVERKKFKFVWDSRGRLSLQFSVFSCSYRISDLIVASLEGESLPRHFSLFRNIFGKNIDLTNLI